MKLNILTKYILLAITIQCFCLANAVLQQNLSKNITTVLFTKDKTTCPRIPTIIRTFEGTFLAFVERREANCDDWSLIDLVVRRSKDGVNWGPAIVVQASQNRTISNLNPVEVTFKNGTRAVLAIYSIIQYPNMPNKEGAQSAKTWSFDDGLTWTDEEIFTDKISLNNPNFKDAKLCKGCLSGPSVGFQDSEGTLWFSLHKKGKGWLFWSKDFGKSWLVGDWQDNLDECSIAPLPNNTIAMNCRSNAPAEEDRTRMQIIWNKNGTVNVPAKRPAVFIDPGCQGSMVSTSNGTLYVSNNNDKKLRRNLSVHRSDDFGLTWGNPTVVKPFSKGPAGYSQIVLWPGYFGVLHEDVTYNKEESVNKVSFTFWPVPESNNSSTSPTKKLRLKKLKKYLK